jgi:hypothetical protein
MRRKNTDGIISTLNNCTIDLGTRGLQARGIVGVMAAIALLTLLLVAGRSLYSVLFS